MQERPGQIGKYWLSRRADSKNWYRTWCESATRRTKRASLGTTDIQEAKIRLCLWYAKHGDVSKQTPQDILLDLVLTRYWEQHAQNITSAESAKVALGYWSDFFAGVTVSEITPPRQREFIKWLQTGSDTPRSDGYVKRILTVGKAALNRAYKEGEITSVPYIIPGKDAPPRDQVLSLQESAALWEAATLPHERMYLALAYGTLARPEAILGLRREFADIQRRLLTQNSPGRKQTKKFRPVVPICDFLLPWILSVDSGPLVHWHGKPIASFKTAWRALRTRAGLPKDTVPKVIRHTMATELRSAGVAAQDIQGMLGHRAYGGATDVYAKYRPDYMADAVRAIDAYMAQLRASQ
ncbi:site-specific integrase [Xylella fastidiosa]|uniref:site-specific integrase n=1 Tax=Xylella fastidiosa TaxID=2371 RepID=UPI0012ACCC60